MDLNRLPNDKKLQLCRWYFKGNSTEVTPSAAARHKRLSGAAQIRYRALKAQGVDPSLAYELSSRSFAELKALGYYFGPPPSSSDRPPKRARSEEESPDRKKFQKMGESPSLDEYPTMETTQLSKRAYSTDLFRCKVGIKDVKPMTDSLVQTLYDAIVAEIANCEKGCGPAFGGLSLKPGWLLISCENQHAKEWLEHCIQSLRPWPGARLSIIEEQDLPKPNVGIVYIPNPEAEDIQRTFDLLRVQNGLNTELWKVLNTKEKKGGVILTISIDDISVQTLKQQDLKAYLAFKSVQFHIKGFNQPNPAAPAYKRSAPTATYVPRGTSPLTPRESSSTSSSPDPDAWLWAGTSSHNFPQTTGASSNPTPIKRPSYHRSSQSDRRGYGRQPF